MDLDRQELPPIPRNAPPQRIPEAKPPLLGDWFIYLSVVVLVCGVVVITALNFGANLRDPIVRVPALIAAVLLVIIAADAAVRAWRSAWGWLPVDRKRGIQRFVWTIVLSAITLGSLAATVALVAL